MSKFINPFTDWGFKYLFGREVSKDILIDFLNDLLEGERVITDLSFLNTEQTPLAREERKAVFDLFCETSTGETIIVEMQNREQPYFKDRGLFYMARTIVGQAPQGLWNYRLKAVYGIFFLNFRLNETGGKFRTDVILADRETGKTFSDKFRQIYLELPRFVKEEEECETDFERWIYVLKNMETLERLPFKARKAVFDRLEKIAATANLTSAQREQYEAEWMAYNDYYNTLDFAVQEGMQKGLQQGMQKGMQQGMQKGLQQGMQEGRQMGLQEGMEQGWKKSQYAIAANLKNLGTSIETIAAATGLSREEIEKL